MKLCLNFLEFLEQDLLFAIQYDQESLSVYRSVHMKMDKTSWTYIDSYYIILTKSNYFV